MRRHGIALALAALLPFAQSAGAGSAAPDPLAQTDRDADGRVDRREFHERQTEVFFLADRDKNGTLSPDELPGLTPERLAAADRDKDGRLSLAEFQEARAADFLEADADHSGALTPAEIEGYPKAGR
jgi:hypothetical protein